MVPATTLPMIRSGILNPGLLALLARFRHTNTIVIADRGFPSWPGVETIDLSVVDDLPTVTDVLGPVLEMCTVGRILMAEEFLASNTKRTASRFAKTAKRLNIEFEPHELLKLRVPNAIGLIRTGDTTQYANIILESA
ncbi:MAG: D-ribose pyranase [Rhodothermales bacterium]|jgi:D-ribose pyranase